MTPCELSSLQEAVCGSVEEPGKFAVHFAPDVISKLGSESWTAFKRVPHRGLEIGGILLGRKESEGDVTTFRVVGFEPLESEHRSGPSFLLSPSDCAALQASLKKSGQMALGLYRSHTRSEQPQVQDADLQLLQMCFQDSDALFLLLSPAAKLAPLYLRANGSLRSVQEFPLPSSLEAALRQSRATTPPRTERRQPREGRRASDAPVAAAPAEVPAPALSPTAPVKRSKWGVILAIMVVALGASVSALSFSRRPTPVAEQKQPEYIRLKVERMGTSLRVLWDGNAPIIRSASRAVLHIDDGAIHTDRDLWPAQLRTGSAIYEPKGSDETFHLDVYTSEPNAIGVVQVINVAPTPAPPVPPVATWVRPAAPREDVPRTFHKPEEDPADSPIPSGSHLP